jgi:hypothetical protein
MQVGLGLRIATPVLLAAVIAVTGAWQAPVPERVPVVLELFTSEGCSSCPPADAVLSKLAKDQPVPNVQIIALGMHVTYWDQLGWKDPASLADATARQQDYGRLFGEDRIYTPQAVIDGRDEVVGSDEAGVTRAIARAAKQRHARVTVSARFQGSDAVVANVAVTEVPPEVKEKTRTLILVTEDGLTSIVKRGENGGRTLHNDAVVRRVSSTAEITGIPPDWRRDHLRVVAIVQGQKSQRIFGAAAAAIQ